MLVHVFFASVWPGPQDASLEAGGVLCPCHSPWYLASSHVHAAAAPFRVVVHHISSSVSFVSCSCGLLHRASFHSRRQCSHRQLPLFNHIALSQHCAFKWLARITIAVTHPVPDLSLKCAHRPCWDYMCALRFAASCLDENQHLLHVAHVSFSVFSCWVSLSSSLDDTP